MSEQEQQLKTRFAIAMLKDVEFDAFKTALEIFGMDSSRALYAARHWPTDSFVVEERARILEELGSKAFLPNKDEQAKEIYSIALKDPDSEIRLKAHRLYAEVMGHIDTSKQKGTMNVLNQGVMIVKDHGSDADWEQAAIERQRKLTSGYGNEAN